MSLIGEFGSVLELCGRGEGIPEAFSLALRGFFCAREVVRVGGGGAVVTLAFGRLAFFCTGRLSRAVLDVSGS